MRMESGEQRPEAGAMADSPGQTWTTVRRKKPRAAKRRPKPRFKRDGACAPPNVGRFVPIRTMAHNPTAAGKRKAGNSSRDRMAKSNPGPIAKAIANQQPIASSADKRLATASPRSVRRAACVKAIAEFVSKVGIGRTYRGVVSSGASQPHEVARLNNARTRLGLGLEFQLGL